MPWFLSLILLWMCPRLRGDPEGVRERILETLALRQQVACLKRRQGRVSLASSDRAFWMLLHRLWSRWSSACLMVRPATVIAWHRAGFRQFWRWKSRSRGKVGRPRVSSEARGLIQRLARENPSWGAPRISGELQKLGVRVSERTVARYLHRRPRDPRRAQQWRQFLANHREVIAAMDFCVVPSLTFGQLYVLVIVDHGRRIVRHLNVTANPTAEWVKAQLREAFPYDEVPKYLIFDRDRIFGAVRSFVVSMGIQPKPISYRSPWQNGLCERLIGTLRRDLLDHVIPLNEAHLRRLLKAYLPYYHEDRTHLGLGKDSPMGPPAESPPSGVREVVSLPRVGGLHHRYTWKRAA